MALTYQEYLHIDELLELQKLRSSPPEHDETLFIIIHQTYELWFKQILHELDFLKKELESGHLWNSVKTMRRVLVIMKTAVAQTDILETMTPLSFNNFRGFLDNASGFQSVQFREIEILCGINYPHMFAHHGEDKKSLDRLEERINERNLWESFCLFLQTKGYSTEMPKRIHQKGLIFEASEKNQQVLLEIMKNDPETALLCELLVDFDEGLQEWRYRHVKMVERTIGRKKGTGGSDGLEYLKNTLHRTIFPDLWAIRTKL